MPANQLRKHKVTKSKRQNERKAPAHKKSTAQKVALERLVWKPVELPDRLEDAEGFYGLEEIDGVEIGHDESGNVEYIVHNEDQSKGENISSDESEWEGFDDDSRATEPEPRNEKKSKKKGSEDQDNSQLKRDVFRLLEDEHEDEGVDVSAWSGLSLMPETLSAIGKLGFKKPTAIQKAAIPEICAGRDVIGKAPTGSGKTLAYGIPILEHILRFHGGSEASMGRFAPTAFIISPTRELALQLEDHLRALCSSVTSHARIATVTGGLDVHKQRRLLSNADIVIGTPGRLWDVFNSSVGLFDGLRKIKFLVIDEADRLLSGGHFREVENILHSLDRVGDGERIGDGLADEDPRQTLVFSATFQRDLQQKLAGKGHGVAEPNSMAYLIEKLTFYDQQGKPRFLDINPGGESQLAPLLKEAMLECGAADKDLYLYATLLLQPPKTKTLVFANSINTVRQITLILQSLQLPAHALHSQMPQKSRLKALERFAAGKIPEAASPSQNASNPSAAASTTGPILVATDVAARGLDIPAVHLVVHYHTPRTADSYIHRSGRTARGDASGTALLLCSPDEVVPVRRLVAKVHAHQKRQSSKAPTGLRSGHLDRTLVGRLQPRISLAAKIASIETNAARARSRDNLFREAAEDLGVDLEENDSDSDDGGRRDAKNGKGKGGAKGSDTHAETKRLRGELRALLSRRVNVGVSESYITSGGMDVEGLLRGDAGVFIGKTGGLELD
jgi:ATP-dependent RNA helicase DDX24/MAK5